MSEDIKVIVPTIKFLKLKNGDNIVALVEISNHEDDGLVTIYNPMKLLSTKFPNRDNTKTSILMAEWLPSEIVAEQMATVYDDDIIAMVDVNEEFRLMYQTCVMRRISLDEIISREEDENVLISLYEDDLEEESEEEVAEKLKKFKQGLN